MWKGDLTVKILLIVVGFMIFSFGVTWLWILLGILLLLGGCIMSFRQGQGMGREACSISKSIARMQETPGKSGQIDAKMYRQAWSVSTGLKYIFAGGIVGYVINCIYIVCMIVKVDGVPLLVTRLASFAVSLPYMPLITYWRPVFDVLTWDIVLMLMVGPFVLPAIQFAGYMQGPRLWAKTEKAMAQGKRRAKARSRIVKKKKPRQIQPEI